MTIYNKLVRDKIPDILLQKGMRVSTTRTASLHETNQYLFAKLVEEAQEFRDEPSEEEAADIMEIILAWFGHNQVNMEKVEKVRLEKLKMRGGFNDKRILLRTAE